ncbi:MAG: response regulator, partial [Rhodospirillales bacterium]|nr:response regulator [Rhodospirillales bacterium]
QRALRILVAEDNPVNQMVIRTLLVRAGHRVDTVSDGSEAVTAVGHGGYDLVLMDLQMPEMDGLSAARAIRRMAPPLGEIPIIALTANALHADRERSIAAGLNDHVAKPVDPANLFAAIARATGAAPPEDAGERFRPAPAAPDAEALEALGAFADALDAPRARSAA